MGVWWSGLFLENGAYIGIEGRALPRDADKARRGEKAARSQGDGPSIHVHAG